MAVTLDQVVARRVRALRERNGFSQADLAQKLSNFGMPIDRSAIARLENGKRGVSLGETMQLAFVLNVAPIHLIVDPDDDEPVAPIPGYEFAPTEARAWIRGEKPMLFQDPRMYWMQVPRAEFEANRPGQEQP